MALIVCVLCVKMQFWKTESPNIIIAEDLVLRSVNQCPLKTELKTVKLKRETKVVSGRTDQLWPYTAVSATVMVLNSARQGPPCAVIDFHTHEDGILDLLEFLSNGLISFTLFLLSAVWQLKKGKAEHLYSALHGIQTTLKC